MATLIYQIVKKPIDERIVDAACIYYEVDRSYFFEKTSDTTVVYKKSIVYYLLKQHTSFTFRYIAEKFGFIGHQPVMRLVDNIDAQKHVARQISNDLTQVMLIADTLDAELITTNISLVTKKKIESE
jgi:chromosomal replication initiation ATPase DnaA